MARGVCLQNVTELPSVETGAFRSPGGETPLSDRPIRGTSPDLKALVNGGLSISEVGRRFSVRPGTVRR